MALRPYQPPNYPAKGGLACDPWGGLSCQLPRFQGQGASETHPSETSHAAQLPDCDLGSQRKFIKRRSDVHTKNSTGKKLVNDRSRRNSPRNRNLRGRVSVEWTSYEPRIVYSKGNRFPGFIVGLRCVSVSYSRYSKVESKPSKCSRTSRSARTDSFQIWLSA